MSRRTARAFAVIVGLLVSAPLHAQSAGPGSARDVLARATDAYGPVDSRAEEKCPPQKAGEEIVVCAELEEQSQFRVQSTGSLDPTGVGAKGPPRAPDVGTVYPGVVVARGCFIPPCPPPMAKIIDLKAIPEAAPGSDADRMARGLAPTGRNEEVTADEGVPLTPRG